MDASIIVPCFKRIDQTLKTISLIFSSENIENYTIEYIVADCSPDNSLKEAVLAKFGDRIIYTRPQSRGIATNKNQAIAIAKGKIVIFCDSDVEVEKDTISKSLQALNKYKTAAALGGTVIWKGGDKDGAQDRPRPEDRTTAVDGVTYTEIIYSRYIATYKEVVKDVGGFDEKIFNILGEASDMFTRFWRAGYPLVYDSSIRVHHCFDAPDSVAIRAPHPQYHMVRNWLLLMYKFDMFDKDYPNFTKTMNIQLSKFGENASGVILQGINEYFEDIVAGKKYLESIKDQKKAPKYDFKFLEVFSDEALLGECISKAEENISKVLNAHLH